MTEIISQEIKADPIWVTIRKVGILSTLRSRVRRLLIKLRHFYLTKIWQMDIHPEARVSLKARLDFSNPRGIKIGQGSSITFDAVILTHDFSRGLHATTTIGKYSLIGTRSIIMPGVNIGDHCVIGAGSVVTQDVPDRSLVVGNPGRIIRKNIMTDSMTRMIDKGEPV